MTNKTFNREITTILDDNHQNDDVISACADLWLNNTTTHAQDKVLDKIKEAAHLGTLSTIQPYYLKDVTT